MYKCELESLASTVSGPGLVSHVYGSPNKYQDDEAIDKQVDEAIDKQIGKGKCVRTRSAPTKTTGSDRRKVRRISAGQGLATIADSVKDAMGSMSKMIVSSLEWQSAPSRPEGLEPLDIIDKAMVAILEDEGFSDDDAACAADVMEGNPSCVRMYLRLTSSGMRTKYLHRLMDKMNNKHIN